MIIMVTYVIASLLAYFILRDTGRKHFFLLRFYFFFLLLSGVLPARAQLKGILKHYSTEDGLSHDGVLSILRDRDGFMWFGTWDGINRFDGHNFIAYKNHPGDRSNLKNNKIRNIVEDQSGYLWVKTYDHQVYRFDKKTERFLAIPTDSKLKNLVIDKMIPASGGKTWLVTSNQGLLCAVNQSPAEDPIIYRYAKSEKGKFNISSDKIKFIFEDHTKKVWIGTSAGVSRMSNGKPNILKNETNAPAVDLSFGSTLSFTCALQNKTNIYFGTEQGILVMYNTISRTFKTKIMTAGVKINALCFSSHKQMLYIATSGKGLISVDPIDFSIRYADSKDLGNFYSLYEDKSGLIWIEPERSGILKYDPKTGIFKLFSQEKDSYALSPTKNYMVFEDVNGTLWTRIKGGGFGYYNQTDDQIEYFYNKPGVWDQRFSNIVTVLYPDKTGILWFSTIDGGINKLVFPGNNFNHRLVVNNFVNKSENEVRALFEDSKNRLWVGTKAGKLAVYKNGKIQDDIFMNIAGSDVGKVYSIIEDRTGTVWVGTKGKGLLMAEPLDKERSKYKLTRFSSDSQDRFSLSSNTVYSILQDRKGRIWVGTLERGLNQIIRNAKGVQFLNHKSSFAKYPAASNLIRHLCEDSLGKIWIATTDGLVVFDPDKGPPANYRFKKYSKIPGDSSSLGNNDVQFIHRDHTGRMWLGTFGGGLNKVISDTRSDNIKFHSFTREDGLPNDIILSVEEDNTGNLWIATENGLSRFNLKAEKFQNYDFYDGLPETQFSEAACFKSHQGILYFGCIKGYISFDPSKIVNRKIEAKMALTNIQLFNVDMVPGAAGSTLKHSLNYTKSVTLKYDQNVINIDYTILDYRADHKISYSYKLYGYDKVWHEVKNQRRATYTNLPPGEYEFVVKSINEAIFSNIPSKSIKITILPPPWLTIWAYLAYLVLALIILEGIRRIVVLMIGLRNKVIIEHKLTELKLEFFTNISHELRTPLTLIVSPLEDLAKKENISEQGMESISIISRNANRMIRFINQLLDLRKIQSGKMRLNISEVDIVALTKEVAQYFKGISKEKNIDFQISADADTLFGWIDEDKVDIIIYNLLSNAFKFSPEDTTISIQIDSTTADEYFTITITDEGYGIAKDKLSEIFELYYEGDKTKDNHLKGTGIGLALAKELVQAHHGSISATNNPSGGMIFSLQFRKGRSHLKDGEVNFANFHQDSPFIAVGDIENEQTNDHVKTQPLGEEGQKDLVLLVEDNPELRKFMSGQLSAFYNVMEASDGKEGYNTAVSSIPDLIISDVMMPGMDGIQMLDKLKNNITTSHIPIILLTAKSSVENQIEGLRYGANFYITKPFHISFVLASVESLLGQRKKQYEALANHEKKLISLSPDEILITSKDEVFLKNVIEIVQKGMEDSEFNIESVAESVGLGRTTFYKKLKSLTSLAPVEFVREMRLKRSKQLLDASEHTISEIAYMTGFKSLGYFSTCFKEKYKVSPSGYIKEQREATFKAVDPEN